ncbi:hypothetical protein ElyMa_005880600 [Elysia marginata]|uniref:MATH domain-containing protein n=1 Tax=Elysia marginata TaxID=1093978 RepID=A0AAV4G2M2_9GAST|nr:hypothetical protein ElyMa_005880600 [Elysia marginata]
MKMELANTETDDAWGCWRWRFHASTPGLAEYPGSYGRRMRGCYLVSPGFVSPTSSRVVGKNISFVVGLSTQEKKKKKTRRTNHNGTRN